ncbi:MAG: hypothetical protein ACLRM9_04725 [Collinsella aerofaciens]
MGWRMLSGIHHPVIRLHRCNFADLAQDVARARGELTDREAQILKAGGIPPKRGQLQARRRAGDQHRQPQRHHGSHGSAPKRNTYRERYTRGNPPRPSAHEPTSTRQPERSIA